MKQRIFDAKPKLTKQSESSTAAGSGPSSIQTPFHLGSDGISSPGEPETQVESGEVCDDLSQLRKTNETPPRVSVYDVIHLLFGISANKASRTFGRMLKLFPEMRGAVNPLWVNCKFPGPGQRETPVADVRGIVRIIMLVPSRMTTPSREKICERVTAYIGTSHETIPVAQPPEAEAPEGSGLEEVLAPLTDADVSRIRKTKDVPPRVSVFDVISSLLGAKNPWQVWRDLSIKFPAVLQLVEDCKFPGERQRETPVADAREIVHIIMLLPCRAAAPVRAKAAEVLVRYLGGDPSLIPDVQANRERQEHLAREEPDNPARIFGEDVESQLSSPLLYDKAPELKGATHHYALRSTAFPGLFKTGSSKDPYKRLQNEERKHQDRLKLTLYAIWRNEGGLEFLARRHLKELPPEAWGILGTEYRITTPSEIEKAMDLAREQYNRSLPKPREEEEDPALKRRRLSLDLDREEYEIKKNNLDLEYEMKKKNLALDKDELELMKSRFELDKEKVLFEKDNQAYRRAPKAST